MRLSVLSLVAGIVPLALALPRCTTRSSSPTRTTASPTSVTPTDFPTSIDPTDIPTSIPASCSHTPGTSVVVTRTLNWEDVDSLAASRVPIPPAYNGFSHSEPEQNKIYRTGDPPASVSRPNVLYANNGRLSLGAVGFPWNPQYFHILTFLDPENGLDKARVRISGVLVQPFEQVITTDRQFVRVDFPPFDRITAVNINIEVFAGDSTTQTLPFWLDDLVYTRRYWAVTCCQLDNPNKPQLTNFDNLSLPNAAFLPSPLKEVRVVKAPVNNPSKPFALEKRASASPLSLKYTRQGTFNLLTLTVTISQYSPPPFVHTQTSISVRGYDSSGGEVGSWQFPASTYQPGTYSISLGSDWREGNTGGLFVSGREGGGGVSGLFTAGGFRELKEIRVQVTEEEFTGPGGQVGSSTPQKFWVDDVLWAKSAGCEQDF